MNRQFYIDLARRGLRMPIGTDLVLREKPDHHAILLDGHRLGQVIVEAARRYRTPLAIHLMDLTVEKEALLHAVGPEGGAPPRHRLAADAGNFHFDSLPPAESLYLLRSGRADILTPRLKANIDAIRHVAACSELVPCGMTIGPFSLATKLLADPITPAFLFGAGAAEDPDVQRLLRVLDMSLAVVLRSVAMQIDAGARLIVVAEPAANTAYFSPHQLAGPGDVFDRLVVQPNRAVRDLLQKHSADLFFHCCGELCDEMVRRFASLEPVILSLGSSRRLWEDAKLVPPHVVLYGNMPTRKFYSDQLMSVEEVRRIRRDLVERMAATGHPFILGSECDVLAVEGCAASIRRKVEAMLE